MINISLTRLSDTDRKLIDKQIMNYNITLNVKALYYDSAAVRVLSAALDLAGLYVSVVSASR